MQILGPTSFRRLNEAGGLILLSSSILLALSLASYHPEDTSSNTATSSPEAQNLTGRAGAAVADLLIQSFGAASFLVVVFLVALAWKWLRSSETGSQPIRLVGAALLMMSAAAGCSLGPGWSLYDGAVSPGGLMGLLMADWLRGVLNLTGASLVTGTCLLVSLYMVSSFSIYRLPGWSRAPGRWARRLTLGWRESLENFRHRRAEKAGRRAEAKESRRNRVMKAAAGASSAARPAVSSPVWTEAGTRDTEIPIRTLDDLEPPPLASEPEPAPAAAAPPEPVAVPGPAVREPLQARPQPEYRLPPTDLLNEPEGRSPYDAQELKDIAVRIKAKFEEFNVLGSVVQINPGPVVTTYEFKPDAGIKYSRITTLNEDLCLGLQAESILIERIPGKPTVGIEVPNSRREVISLRQILESEEFASPNSRLTISLGKDISGRIKVTTLDSMPHLLIAGSTGSGKSVMLNSLIMSILYKSTPNDVRMILIDPKRVEMGIYEGIPHLLTPVITDPRKATNALRNAVMEMERRLKLLAGQGVRNIDQYNRKVRQKQYEPRPLFDDQALEEELEPLPCILVVIDELADLMMVERANVEESVTRLAQMARAVGMHLVVATQRPSVDVITGLIKANFPARISFRVATRVDSRTILDVMGSEHLLGRGDMLFLPPGSSRLIRVHGPLVTEAEINNVVEFWRRQAQPDYDQSFLLPPPGDEDDGPAEGFEGADDPAYADAVRVVLEVGKASTSILQRRLRLGYGRAARLLDIMQAEGIIGAPDGSRAREVLKRPDWLREVEEQLR